MHFYSFLSFPGFRILLPVWCLLGVIIQAMVSGIIVREFKLQSFYCVYFRTNTLWERYESPYHPIYGLNRTTTVLLEEKL